MTGEQTAEDDEVVWEVSYLAKAAVDPGPVLLRTSEKEASICSGQQAVPPEC